MGSARYSPRSTSARFDPADPGRFLDLVQQDIRLAATVLNAPQLIYLSAPDRVVIPMSSSVDVYLVTNTATATSTGVNYHTVRALRCGQNEGAVGLDSRNVEIAAYTALYCGTFAAGFGNIMSFSITVGGAPVPTLTAANFSMLCVLTPEVTHV